jgi:hypothetical protein
MDGVLAQYLATRDRLTRAVAEVAAIRAELRPLVSAIVDHGRTHHVDQLVHGQTKLQLKTRAGYCPLNHRQLLASCCEYQQSLHPTADPAEIRRIAHAQCSWIWSRRTPCATPYITRDPLRPYRKRRRRVTT